jgi:hypothetical protein
MVDGIDCATDCTKRVGAIKQMGVDFVGRYYRLPHSQWDALTVTEAQALSQGDLKIVSLWESRSDRLIISHTPRASMKARARIARP